jgi:uncharacterized membrane protein
MIEVLSASVETVAVAIKIVAVLVVVWATIEAALGCLALIVRGQAGHGARKVVWRRFGVWLVLGLEFLLAADIVETVLSPDWLDVAMLGAIAVIRTFLNYFLEKDLEAAVREGEVAREPTLSRAS